jgi:hypothetical protein
MRGAVKTGLVLIDNIDKCYSLLPRSPQLPTLRAVQLVGSNQACLRLIRCVSTCAAGRLVYLEGLSLCGHGVRNLGGAADSRSISD